MTAPDEFLAPIRARLAAQLPEDARMDAYYYGFDRTNVGPVDAILSAVAIAGKGSHHTDAWGEGDTDYYRNRPGLPDAESGADLIQKAAEQSARAIAETQARLLAALDGVEDRLKDLDAIEHVDPSGPGHCNVSAKGVARQIRAAIQTALEGQG